MSNLTKTKCKNCGIFLSFWRNRYYHDNTENPKDCDNPEPLIEKPKQRIDKNNNILKKGLK